MNSKDQSIKLVVFDLAGTTVDFGSRAPVLAFTELFKRHKINLDEAEVRGPMGMNKKDHIREVITHGEGAAVWKKTHGAPADEEAVESLYREFIPLQKKVILEHSDFIPGALETARKLKERNIKIALTTGYSREMSQPLLQKMKESGFDYDISVCPDEVKEGRPAPWMILKAAMELNIYPFDSILNLGDTIADTQSGTNARVWSAGVTRTGNMLGNSLEDDKLTDAVTLKAQIRKAALKMQRNGADFTIESVKEIPLLIEKINLIMMG